MAETRLQFDKQYQFCWIKNVGEEDAYVSNHSNIVVGSDNVALLKTGESVLLTMLSDSVYILGDTTVEAHAQDISDCPFTDTIIVEGGGSADVEPIMIRSNGEYIAPEGKAYSPVTVQVPSISVSKLTVGHNNVTYEAGIGTAFDPVEVSIPMDTLNAPTNGVYEIDENTDGWDTVLVDTYEKFEVVYSNGARTPENSNGLIKPLTATDYDEFYMTAFYAYNDQSAPTATYAAIWSTRYPIDAMMHKTNVGACGSDNYMWTHANQYDPADEIRGFYAGNFSGYAFPFVYIGVKDRDAQRTTLYHDGTAAIRTDITLSDSIFNYDELILTFATGAYQSNNHATASAYPVSTIQIGKQLCGFNDATGAYFTYEVTSATQLTLVHYQDFYLVDVQGIKNDSMEETVIFTNPSSSSIPATITLSQTYKNFDEICLVGHTADAQFEDMIITQYYPVKALTREFDVPVDKRISLFLDAENCWLTIHGDTTLVPDSVYTIILDKIIGINKPVVSTAHELIDVEPLSVTQNGIYAALGGSAYSPVTVDVYEKYHELYTGGANMNPAYCYFNDTVNTDTYDELWIEGQYIYTQDSNKNIALWSGRYPTSVLYQNNRFIGAIGGHNHQWTRPNPVGTFTQTVLAEYDYPYAFFGVKSKNRTEECLWANTESATPSTVALSDSIFDYDEICLYFVKGDGATTTSWYLTDELSVGDIVQGYDDTYATTLNKYTIASDTTLTTLSETGGYVLMGVYGINDTSLSETTLYTNPDPTTAPATVTLSDSYANYDEIVLLGHIPSEDTICSYSYPVKILGRWTHDAYRDRMGVFSNQRSYWLTFTSNTTLVADANPTIILDKIIGIKRPVTTEAVQNAAEIISRADWDLMTEAQKQTKGLCAIQDSSTGFMRGDFINGADYIQSNKYIPYSNEYKIISVAYPDLFDTSANSWGYGTSPVLYTGTGGKPTLSTQEQAIYFPTKTSDVVGYVDLGDINTPFTAYIVMKAAASSPGRFLSCINSANNAYLIMFSGAGDNISIDNWGNGTDLGVNAVSDYCVAAMTYTPQTGWGFVYDAANDRINSAGKTVLACGRYLTIARTDIDPNVMYPAPTDVYIKYIAVVNEAETSTTIENNLRALYNQFVGE